MKVQNYRQLLLWALALRRLEMARESGKCPPGSEPLNPPGWFPAEVIPPGTEVPDGELPPDEEPPEEPEPEEPPHEGDEVTEGPAEQSAEQDEILEEVVLGGSMLEELAEEGDALSEDVVAAPPSPLVTEFHLDRSMESDLLVEEVELGQAPHVPQIYNQGLIDQTRESDLISEQVIVADPAPEDPDLPEPPATGNWDKILQNITLQGDVLVPAGKRWLIGEGVRIRGNLRTVAGTIGMRPGSSLEFIGGDPSKYVGGGMTYDPAFANDFGIWIGEHGKLDIRGTPKVGWNRSGVDPTWDSDDELWIAPTAKGDWAPRRWFPGQPIPRVSALVPPAEIVNTTRDIVIKGSPTGHIHIHSHEPQRIEYCRLENMGVTAPNGGGKTSGRYCLHFHHGFDGTRGTTIKGVVSINAKGRGYVPHLSHGISWIDCVSVNSEAEGFWWDTPDFTNDTLVDRMCVIGVNAGSKSNRIDAFHLPGGTGNVMKNCVAAGILGNKQSACFRWPDGNQAHPPRIWIFDEGNVAHNCRGVGVRFWTNIDEAHIVANYKSYRNGICGIENGAYLNGIEYHNVVCFEEGHSSASGQYSGVLWHSNSRLNTEGEPAQITDSVIVANLGPAIHVGERQLIAGVGRSTFVNCVLTASSGFPKVVIQAGGFFTKPWRGLFIECPGLEPTDFVFETSDKAEGSDIQINDEDGPKWRIEYQKGAPGNRKVTAL